MLFLVTMVKHPLISVYFFKKASMKQIVKRSQYEINTNLNYYKCAAMWPWTYKKCHSQYKQHRWHSILLSCSVNNLWDAWYNFIRNKFEICTEKSVLDALVSCFYYFMEQFHLSQHKRFNMLPTKKHSNTCSNLIFPK